MRDLIDCFEEVRDRPSIPSRLASFAGEDSLPAVLLRGGNFESWVSESVSE